MNRRLTAWQYHERYADFFYVLRCFGAKGSCRGLRLGLQGLGMYGRLLGHEAMLFGAWALFGKEERCGLRGYLMRVHGVMET